MPPPLALSPAPTGKKPQKKVKENQSPPVYIYVTNETTKKMKAFYFTTCTTDLVRTNDTPLIKYVDKELCTDFEDFMYVPRLRFCGIKRDYPTAKFQATETGARVFVDGVLVYEINVIAIDETPVEVDAWNEPIGTDFA